MTDHLAALHADVFIVISLFLNDKDACSLFRTSRSMLRIGRLPSLWKARSMTFMSAIQSPVMVSAFRRDIAVADTVGFDWAERYRLARLRHPKGLLISADLLAWFDVADAVTPPPAVAKVDPDSDTEMSESPDERLSAPGAFLHHFFQRLLHPNEELAAAVPVDISVMMETDEGRADENVHAAAARMARDHALSLSRFMRTRTNNPAGGPAGHCQKTSQFLHGRLVTVQRLVPSSSRARLWARTHSRDPIQKLARYHRYGMFWLQIDHDDMSFRADKPFLRPSCWEPGRGRAPAPVLVSYFECTVVRQPMAVGIGLCDDKFHSRTPGVFIGWPASPGASYGFHGDDGLKFHNDGRGQEYSGPYGAGDTIGCGLDWSRGSIFFTKNGVFLGEAFRDVQVDDEAKWFPTVSLKHILSRRPNALKNDDDPDDDATDAVVFNSGMQGAPFVYNLQEYPVHGNSNLVLNI